MEIPTLHTKKRRLKHAITTLALFTALAALPASIQTTSGETTSGETNSPPPAQPSWSILEDADLDGITDADELLLSMDPLNPEDGLSDLDGDEIDLAWELSIGTNPDVADTDMDDWSDSEEYLLYGTDPLDALSFPLDEAPDDGEGTTLESATIEAEAVLSPPPPPPTLSNGDFSDAKITTWKNAVKSTHYQGRGFLWAYCANEAVGGWTAYAGNSVEIWQAGGEQFVELDGSRGNYGIKQPIKDAKAGGYVLTWRQSGRNSTRAGTDPYCVRIYYMNGTSQEKIAQSAEFSGIDKKQWTDNAFGFQITPEQLDKAKNIVYVAFIPSGSSLNTYGTLIDKVSLLPMELKACKRGSIEKPGTPISGKEVVTIENGDLDQFDHETTTRALTPADVTNRDLQDARINRAGQRLTSNAIQFDNDFVKFYCDGAFIPKDSKWTIELEIIPPTGTKAIAANQIFFYTKEGEHVDLSQLNLTNAAIPATGVLHDLFDKDRGIFAEIGDLGNASSNSSQPESGEAKVWTVILKIGGDTGTDGIKLKRGGFWVYDRTSDNGLTFRDGYVEFKSSGETNNVEDGDVLFGPYAVKSGQRGCNNDTTKNKGPSPAGWWMLTERTGSSDDGVFVWQKHEGRWMRSGNCQSDRSIFPSPLNDSNAKEDIDQSPKLYQGAYSLWDITGHFEADQKVYYPKSDGEQHPTSIMFKFDLNKMLSSQTKRTDIQIHPDGHNDGTLGCIGLQNYQNAIRTNYLLKHLRAIPISVRGTPSNNWNTTNN